MEPRIGAYTRDDIKWKFAQLDTDGDGHLTFSELATLLRKGDSEMKDEEVLLLFKALDHDSDGHVDFDEFVDFIFREVGEQDEKVDWKGARRTFERFTGKDARLDARELVKMCRDCDLFDHNQFGVTDADLLFKKVHNPMERGLGFKEFKKVMRLIAKKKSMPLRSCVAWMANLTAPPV
mmetsp:Transcript_61571/g.133273  ORF Transcript_61571/g.133273 Transcript_61571/m.133273 type:complete len:179 (-) Transcript_61571:36-572(-)|eukprot:CAMPEP_0170595232 /NCGR_PEP_ID=MMETSP0224-20130122/14446_1 /TAXON_ID=285029 /ORGANISM="Togula jolla, Strain CCCM 725" /LENGTH=178 /DNA_ID=CAMNT_0010919387 /DNA_START=34 /DNA_END=570 /DNA_ORIENTATION=+